MNRSSLFNTQNNIEHIFIINLGKLEVRKLDTYQTNNQN